MFMALKNCHDIKQYFKRQLLKQRYCIDRNGHRTIELFLKSNFSLIFT